MAMPVMKILKPLIDVIDFNGIGESRSGVKWRQSF